MDYEIEDLDVVFFRHKFSKTRDEADVRQLWENEKVALHWGQNDSTDPSDYDNSTAQSELSRLHEYGENGSIVAAYYGNDYDIHPDEMLIGVVPPGSEPVGEQIGDSIFKTLSMESTVIASFRDYPTLSALRPRGHSLCRWPAAGDQVRSILADGQLPAEVGSLSPDQLEVACNEFLRIRLDGYFPTLPIGRTLPDVDIMGGTSDERVLAQVTQESDQGKLQSKAHALQNYADEDTRPVLFGPDRGSQNGTNDAEYISVEDVFETLYQDEGQGRLMLARMLNPA